ncbi:MAG: ribosome silencing factor [Mangrovibacterium sp.]
MSHTQQEKNPDQLLSAIIEGIERKKGLDIVKIDLSKINHSVCNYFIICHGNSSTHVEAIARSVEDTVEELAGEKAWHRDGYQNAIWILLDYSDVIVHIFQHETRNFYDIENLWADAAIERIHSENQHS